MWAGVKAAVPKTLITILCGYRGHKNVFVNDFMHSVFKHKTSFILCRFLTVWLECFDAISADFHWKYGLSCFCFKY